MQIVRSFGGRQAVCATFLGMLIFLAAFAVLADDHEETGWRVSAGGLGRRIEVRFRGVEVRDAGFGETPYVNFARQGTAWHLADPAAQSTGGYVPNGAFSTAFVTADRAAWRGDREHEDSFGGTLDFSRDIMRRGDLSLSVVLSLSVLQLNADSGGRAAPGSEFGFGTSHSVFEIHAPTPPVDPGLTQLLPTGDWGEIGGSVIGPTGTVPGLAGATVSVDTDVAAAFYEIGLGCSARYSLGRMCLCVSTGPVLSLSDVESSHRQRIQTGSSGSSWRRGDSDSDVLFGWSVRCGIDVLVTPSFSVGVGARYEAFDGTVSTRHVDIDPSGFGVDARLALLF